MANRKCICDRCGRPNKFRGICRACADAINRMVDDYVADVVPFRRKEVA